MADRRWLVIMAREPRCGAVKTRLVSDIGAVSATGFYRRTLISVSRRLGRDPRWTTLISVTPDVSVTSACWPRGIGLLCQGPGELGARMQRLFDGLPPGPVVIIGSDIPGITSEQVAAAFAALGGHEAVVGPGEDGGYWLIGLRRTPRSPDIFSGVRWSTPNTLADTLTNLKGMKVGMLAPLGDVDDGDSHRRLGAAGGRFVLPTATG